MKVISLVSDWLYKLEKIMAVILMGTMLLSIALGVAFRYVLGNPLTWSDELAIYMLIWLTFLGGSMSVKTGRASSLDLVFDRMNLLWKKIFLFVGHLVVIIFTVVVVYMAIKWVSNPSIKTQLSPGLKISMFLPYLAVPFGLACMMIHSISHLANSLKYSEEQQEPVTEGGE